MKNKRIFKTFSALCAALVLMASFSVTAFAQGTEQPPAEDTTNDSNVVVEETEDSPALTPDGNAALVDDFGGNKQLITVTTKAGNYEHPADYRHPSMSVSDIVAIKRDGKVSCHYCDSFGFEQVPGFLPDNPLKNAEMAVEDDYGMIDGIINNGPKEPTVAQLEQQARSGQPISLMDLAAATHREEREKKKSVMEQLKSQPKAEHKKTAPKKSAEREL